MKGHGKTTLVRNLSESSNRAIFVDPKKQFHKGLIVTSYEEFEDYICKYNPDKFRIICRFRDDMEFSQTEKVFAFATECKELDVIVDEVDMICSPNKIGEAFWNVVEYGRNDKINLFCTAKRPAEVHRSLTAIADKIYCFRVEEPNDLDYMKKRGFDPDKIKSLPKFEFLSNN